MKSESGPLKYRLARRRVYGEFQDPFAPDVYEYFLQGWFEWEERDSNENPIGYVSGGEWRTLDTVDLEG